MIATLCAVVANLVRREEQTALGPEAFMPWLEESAEAVKLRELEEVHRKLRVAR